MSKWKADIRPEAEKKTHELTKSIKKSMEKSFPASEFPLSVYIIFDAHCRACLLDFTVSRWDIFDVHHVKTARHCKIGKVVTPFVTNFFRKALNESQNLDVIQAETLFTNFLVEHNIALTSLSAVDSAGNLFFYVFFRTAQQLNSMAVAKR